MSARIPQLLSLFLIELAFLIYMFVTVCTRECSAYRVQKRAPDPRAGITCGDKLPSRGPETKP